MSRWLLAFSILILSFQSAPALCHKYASHNFDARVEGNTVLFDLQVDTISTMELVETDKPNLKGIQRQEVAPHRQLVYDYLIEHLYVESGGRRCKPSTLFTFEYLPKIDKFYFAFVVDCGEPIETMTINFSLFIEQVGLNTTIATVFGRKGGERYVFMDRSKATIRMSDLTGAPRPLKQIMKNYDPSKGFRSEVDRLKALGKSAEVIESKNEDYREEKGDVVEAEKIGTGFVVFLRQGIDHILTGLDHILFVICLLVVVYEWKQLALVISAFTVAHTISLILATFGLVKVSSAIVDPLIAASIIYVAVENLFKDKARARLAVTFGFGLFHGLGFSAVLRELLSGSDIGWALFGFNLGVEIGQLLVVLPLFPILIYVKKQNEKWHKRSVQALCAVVAVVASYWFVERVIAVATM